MTVKIRTRKKFLAACKACMDIYRHAPGFKGRTFVSSAFSAPTYIHDTPPVGRRVGRPGNRNIFRWHTSALSGGRPLPLPVGICNQKDHTKWKAYPSVSQIHKFIFQLHSIQFKQTHIQVLQITKQIALIVASQSSDVIKLSQLTASLTHNVTKGRTQMAKAIQHPHTPDRMPT